MSSGRLGPPSRAPSCRRRRNDASPPGPESRSTALPMIARSRASHARAVSGVAAAGPQPVLPPPGGALAVAAVAAAGAAGAVAPAPGSPWLWGWRSRSSWTHSRTRSSSAPGLTSPVTNGAIAASHATASAASPSSQAPPPPPCEARARCPAHWARTRAVHSCSSAELPSSFIRSAREMWTTALTGCPARSGSSPAVTSRRMASCSASWQRCGWLRASSAPAGADRASSTVATIEAHSGVRSPVSTPAPPNVVSTRTDRSPNASPSSWSGVLWGGTGRRSPRPARPGPPHPRRPPPPRAGSRPRPRWQSGELAGPPADGPGDRLRDLPGGQRRGDLRVRGGPPDPRGVPGGGALGHVGLVDQPGPRAVVRVIGVPLPGGERGQDRGPRRGPDRGDLLQHPQAPRLGLRRHRGRIRGGQVAHRRLQHPQRLHGAGRRRNGDGLAHLAHLLGDCSRAGGWVPSPGSGCSVSCSTLVADPDIFRPKRAFAASLIRNR